MMNAEIPVRIFDTTLRDGEQAPGAGLTVAEKLEVARQLVRLNVDIIEAGFPASSPGDFEAVEKIAKETKGVAIAALASFHSLTAPVFSAMVINLRSSVWKAATMSDLTSCSVEQSIA